MENPAKASVPLVKSSFVQSVEGPKGVIIWHSLFGHPQILSKSAFDLLQKHRSPQTTDSLE